MPPIPIEACIACSGPGAVQQSAEQAHRGGAARIELCRALSTGGLTPPDDHVRLARAAFPRPGVLVMIRPRAGDFTYSAPEIDRMRTAIKHAAEAGADGVVLGALKGGRIDEAATRTLTATAHERSLAVTFHRAFDAVPETEDALETLVAMGVERVLTSGTPWNSGASALDGLDRLAALIRQAERRIEIVVGGGIGPENAARVLSALPAGRVSVHAYSSLVREGLTRADRVAALVRQAHTRHA